MSTAQQKIGEMKALLAELDALPKPVSFGATADQPLESAPYGADLSEWIDKFMAYIKSLDVGSMKDDAIHMIIHALRELALPKLQEQLPVYARWIIPLVDAWLAKIDERFHPTA